jgi:hypothetical protein
LVLKAVILFAILAIAAAGAVCAQTVKDRHSSSNKRAGAFKHRWKRIDLIRQ